MADIRISNDVRHALGPDGVAKASAATLNNARCLSCELVFKAQEGDGLVSTSAARVLRCPTGCGEQAFRGSALRQWRPAAQGLEASLG